VQRLITKGEGQFLEFKPGAMRPTELAASLAAFANADGGTLLLGVLERSDGTPVIEGVGNRKLAVDHLHTAAGLCSPKLELTPPEEIEVGDLLVLAVTVPAGLRQVYSADGRYVVREGSFRRTLGAEEIRGLLTRRGLFAYDTMAVPGAIRSDLDPELVRRYVERYRSGRRMDADALLEARELLVRPDGDRQTAPVPSVAGMLLLGKDPQRFFPQARMAVVQYAGTEMGERFLKREIEGTLPSQLEEAVAWLARATLHAVELRGSTRLDRDEFPPEALRETVLNALAHRDYSLRGDRIRIYVFADRIEVHSPGGLGGPMRLDNLLERRWSRNATLVQGLVALDLIEELGFGLDRMVAAMAEAGLPAPVFKELGETFVVTLYGAGVGLLQSGATATEQRAARRVSPSERQDWILNYIRTVGPLSPRAYVEAVGIDRKTALTDLRALAERGLIQAQGTTTDRRYTLAREER
jgi:ATP-dependent DNA helicase RecG